MVVGRRAKLTVTAFVLGQKTRANTLVHGISALKCLACTGGRMVEYMRVVGRMANGMELALSITASGFTKVNGLKVIKVGCMRIILELFYCAI